MNTVYSLSELQKSRFTHEPHYLVIGNPITHSLSPVMHQTALEYHKLKATYLALQLIPENISSFAAWCNKDAFLGCNITIPYKETLMNLVDQVDPHAQEVGVINTIEKVNSNLKGHNTDVYGFLKPVEEYMDYIKGQRAVVFGTGGASKAVKTGLIAAGIEEIIFVSRNPASNKIEDDRVYSKTVDYSQWQDFAEESMIFINTTPVGMLTKGNNELIDKHEGPLLSDKLCYDLIYNPKITPFLELASANNAIPVNGLDMLIYQGSRSFEIWTGKTFPIDLVRTNLQKSFE